MKQLFFFILLTFNFSFAQSFKEEKISFSEYDNLKYIMSIDSNSKFYDSITRFYDVDNNIIYSSSSFSLLNKNMDLKIYNPYLYEYFYTDIISNIEIEVTGVLKIVGSNKFFILTVCNSVDGCEHYYYLNEKKISQSISKLK